MGARRRNEKFAMPSAHAQLVHAFDSHGSLAHPLPTMRGFAISLVLAIASCSPGRRPIAPTQSTQPADESSIPPATPMTPLACGEHAEIAYPATLSACATAADCIVVEHTLDCCGSVLKAGIAASQRAAFDSIETSCRAQVNARVCGCAAYVASQIGERITPATPVAVRCVSGACVASSAASVRAAVQ